MAIAALASTTPASKPITNSDICPPYAPAKNVPKAARACAMFPSGTYSPD